MPGAVPDPNPQTLDQATSIRRIARWMGIALRALVNDERLARHRLERGGTRSGSVTVDIIEP